MVFFVNDKGNLRTFLSENEMKAAGFKKAIDTATEEEYNSNGCYARLINDEVIIGKTKEEKAAEEKQEKIDGYLAELAELDRKAGAGRFIRDTSIAYAKKNGMDKGEGYDHLVEIETRAAEIRESLAPLLETAE